MAWAWRADKSTKPAGARGLDLGRRAAGALEEAVEAAQALGHQPLLGDVGVLRAADDLDHPVDVHHRQAEALDDLAPGLGLAQIEQGPAGDDVAAVLDEDLERAAQRQHHRAAVDDRQHVDAERALQRGRLVQVVQGHLLVGVALELEHHPHAGAIALVADVGDALEALVADQIGAVLDPPRLVDHVRQLGDHDRLAILADLLDGGPAAHDHRAAPGLERRQDPGPALDDAAGREVGAGDQLEQLVVGQVGPLDQGQDAADDLGQVVRRDRRGHADRDAGGAVQEQVRDLGRQDRGLELLVVVVRLPVDGLLVEIGEQLARRSWPGGTRCNAWRPADRRRPSRSCPGRRRACSASRSPGPCGPGRRRPRRRRAGGTCR
jgi:hypothetical protein